MLKNHPKNELIQNNEDRNRNLLKKYMNENLGNFGLSYLVIVAECNVEDKNHNSIGYSDLKIFNFSDYNMENKEEMCFIIECKCLNKNYGGDKSLKKHYISEGILRFKKKYPSPFGVGSMLSFVQIKTPKDFIDKIKNFVEQNKINFIKSEFKESERVKSLFTHVTKHKNIEIYHLFLDMNKRQTL